MTEEQVEDGARVLDRPNDGMAAASLAPCARRTPLHRDATQALGGCRRKRLRWLTAHCSIGRLTDHMPSPIKSSPKVALQEPSHSRATAEQLGWVMAWVVVHLPPSCDSNAAQRLAIEAA